MSRCFLSRQPRRPIERQPDIFQHVSPAADLKPALTSSQMVSLNMLTAGRDESSEWMSPGEADPQWETWRDVLMMGEGEGGEWGA